MKIVKVDPMFHGHLLLEFEDGSKKVVNRGSHELLNLKPGDSWPPTLGAPVAQVKEADVQAA